jgi:hypothetical protein
MWNRINSKAIHAFVQPEAEDVLNKRSLLKCVMKQQHDTEISAVPLGRYRLAK